jgi:hypothetical protein
MKRKEREKLLKTYLDSKIKEWVDSHSRHGVIDFRKRPEPTQSVEMYHDPDISNAHRLDAFIRSIKEDILTGKISEDLVGDRDRLSGHEKYFWSNIDRFAKVAWHVVEDEK